ncbi:hypothetical protein MKL29_06825 [Streptococcus suis]|nr:hypothetical protein [Streptococcus suis]
MFSLSKESENSLKKSILKLIKNFLSSYSKPQPRQLGLMTPKQIEEELEVKASTLKRWEHAGLKRYQPPLENTKKVFYKVDDILEFLGVDV